MITTEIFIGSSIGLIFVLISSFWVCNDAGEHKISIDGKSYNANNGAWAWFFSCLLLWIVFFPYYLHRKNQLFRPAINQSNKNNFPAEEQLRSLKRMLEQELISKEDYEKKKKELLGL